MNRKTFGSRSCHERCKIIKVIVIMQMLWFEYTFISSSNFVSSCFKRIIMLYAFPIKESCLTRIQFTVHWINIEKKTWLCIYLWPVATGLVNVSACFVYHNLLRNCCFHVKLQNSRQFNLKFQEYLKRKSLLDIPWRMTLRWVWYKTTTW